MGPDEIHPRILKKLTEEILSPLKILFETSFQERKLTDDWREPGNYRSISLTSIV